MASSELLKQIQAGKKLKKAETLDRSAPIIDAKASKGGGASPMAAAAAAAGGGRPSGGGGPPQLGGLFAGGMPTLKKTAGSPGMSPTTVHHLDNLDLILFLPSPSTKSRKTACYT